MAENADALEVFLACQTQWRVIVAMSAIYQGLDYSSVEAVIRLGGYPKKRHGELFQQVRLIEMGALSALSRQTKRT